ARRSISSCWGSSSLATTSISTMVFDTHGETSSPQKEESALIGLPSNLTPCIGRAISGGKTPMRRLRGPKNFRFLHVY
uniref:Uncharacterized protein n=1 Tax=Chenopodium quinoa TaxID=63459 RepID=A0A803MME8_CHEQI